MLHSYDYEFADEAVKILNKRFIEMFSSVRGLTSFDEIHVLGSVRTLYEEMYELVKRAYLSIARNTYRKVTGEESDIIDEMWILAFLESYDPVTKYVFAHEVERKMYYLAEALIASDTKTAEVDKALRLWSAMITQFSITVTDKAVEQAYIDNDVKKVRWITKKDEKVCAVCEARDGKIYILSKVPSKPHIGCRCKTKPV